MKIVAAKKILKANDQFAVENRKRLTAERVYGVNLVGSPGCGKTTLLESLFQRLKDRVSPAVIEGDIAGQIDAERMARMGVPVVQINTEGMCHLDANMIAAATDDLDCSAADLLVIENSTFDSIGSSLAAVFTRDFYARFLVRRKDDGHYLLVSRVSTFLLIGVSFAYIPFMDVGMVELYLQLVGVAVLPLLTVYLMGVFTRVHRSSATIGLIAGIICGLGRLATASFAALPVWWTNKWWGYLWSIGATVLAMIVTSTIRGWATHDEIAGLTLSNAREQRRLHAPAIAGTWLERSQQQVPVSMPVTHRGPSWYNNPVVWSILVLTVLGVFNLALFW